MAGARHVWVRRPFAPSELPGLVLEWRRGEEGWQALVVFIESRGRIVTEWIAADSLRPLDARPGTGSAYG